MNYKRYVEPFIAIFILLGLMYACVMGYQNYQAKKDIAKDCGWDDGEVRCLCSKIFVLSKEIALEDHYEEVLFNVSLDE
ncbi:hypothetical protein KAT51_00890 [bacterium]|nr:hypothetical protein [bacterium]